MSLICLFGLVSVFSGSFFFGNARLQYRIGSITNEADGIVVMAKVAVNMASSVMDIVFQRLNAPLAAGIISFFANVVVVFPASRGICFSCYF